MNNSKDTSTYTQGSFDPFVTSPASETLGNLNPQSLWPTSVRVNQQLNRLAHDRRTLSALLSHLFTQVPDATLDFGEALTLGLVSENDLIQTYNALSTFLESEEYNERILLYLPLELVPGTDWNLTSENLIAASRSFSAVYMRKWRLLLKEHDLTANFVDGDIPEVEIRKGPLPTVVKAAHFAPILVKKGLLSITTVEEILATTSDEVLRTSLAESLAPNDTKVVRVDTLMFGMHSISARILQAEKEIISRKQKMYHALASEPQKRIEWKIREMERAVIKECAQIISRSVIEDTVSPSHIHHYVRSARTNCPREIIVLALGHACEVVAKKNLKYAKELYASHTETLRELWYSSDSALATTLRSVYSRLITLNIMTQEESLALGITIPSFSGITNLHEYSGLDTLTRAARIVGTDLRLTPFLLPVVIACGSRVKGYHGPNSDVDITVCIKPGISIYLRSSIQALLSKALEPIGLTGKPMEFWLEEVSTGLRIRDFADPDRSLGDSALTSPLFGGIYAGDKGAIRDLYQKLLVPYLYPQGQTVFGTEARKIWIGEIERDTLQFRLMHKGYAFFYPEQKSKHVPHKGVDTGGSFWDAGYRRIATQLFIRKVFLPNLGSET